MNKFNFLIIAASLLIPAAGKAAVKEYKCEIDFEFDSAEVDASKLKNCLKKVNKKDVRFFHVFATASYPGTQEYNRELSDKRAEEITKILKNMYPKSTVEKVGGGENPLGQKAKVFALTASTETIKVPANDGLSSVRQSKAKPASSRNRFAVRGGVDQFKDSDTNYKTVGAEVSRRTKMYKRRYFGEYGAGINHHSDDDMLDLYSVNGFGGGGYKRGLFVTGVRGFAGNMAREDNKDNVLNVGAEARIGVENERYSAFLTGGTSKETHALGLDVGVRF